MTYFTTVSSPIGDLLLTGDGEALTGLHMAPFRTPTGLRDDAKFAAARQQLKEYFAGRRQSFDLPLRTDGTDFQSRVWRQLQRIPFGTTISYRELARRVGNSKASRAVGSANGKNPIAVIVPCHRVVAADGSLGGFGGGLDRKRYLLELEGARR